VKRGSAYDLKIGAPGRHPCDQGHSKRRFWRKWSESVVLQGWRGGPKGRWGENSLSKSAAL